MKVFGSFRANETHEALAAAYGLIHVQARALLGLKPDRHESRVLGHAGPFALFVLSSDGHRNTFVTEPSL
jgi:hypothetical protein